MLLIIGSNYFDVDLCVPFNRNKVKKLRSYGHSIKTTASCPVVQDVAAGTMASHDSITEITLSVV